MWFLILSVYVAPPDAVNWKGSWELGMTKMMERRFESELNCINAGKGTKARLNEGMLAPVRFKCVQIASGLPAGASR